MSHPEAKCLMAEIEDLVKPRQPSFFQPDYNPYAAAFAEGQRNIYELLRYYHEDFKNKHIDDNEQH